MPRRALLLVLLLAAPPSALAACGGGDAASETTPRAQAPTTRTAPPPGATPPGRPSPYDPPTGVPRTGSGAPADEQRLAVVRAWVDALRAGRVGAAADSFADGARIQNGTPVVELASRLERRAYMLAGFPCGARVTDAQDGGRGFLVVQFAITDRVGGSPGCAGGPSAYAAIKVEGGEITEWYRLPDPAGAAAPGETTES